MELHSFTQPNASSPRSCSFQRQPFLSLSLCLVSQLHSLDMPHRKTTFRFCSEAVASYLQLCKQLLSCFPAVILHINKMQLAAQFEWSITLSFHCLFPLFCKAWPGHENHPSPGTNHYRFVCSLLALLHLGNSWGTSRITGPGDPISAKCWASICAECCVPSMKKWCLQSGCLVWDASFQTDGLGQEWQFEVNVIRGPGILTCKNGWRSCSCSFWTRRSI